MKKDKLEDLPLLPPQFFLNSVNRNNGFVTDRQEYIINEFEVKKWSQTLDICDFTTATSVLSLARKADLSKATYFLLE